MVVYKALAALLIYPDAMLIASLPEIDQILRHAELPSPQRAAILSFAARLASTDLLEAQGDYVALFDNDPSLSLYLFQHVHGDSRERGQAMVDLMEDYRRMGLDMRADELPDFLPAFLEFASLHPTPQARALLGEIAEVVALLASRLERRGTQYAVVLRAIEALGSRPADQEQVDARLAGEQPTGTPEALDARYEEAPVDFTQPVTSDSPCSKAAALVAQCSRDLPQAPPTLRQDEESASWTG